MNTRKIGTEYEERAAEFLKGQGVSILERNFRCRMGEVDIISKDGDVICFVEVKYRKGNKAGFPEEAVSRTKQRVISRTADFYRMKKGLPEDRPYRFDVISIMGEETVWHKNAFEYVPY